MVKSRHRRKLATSLAFAIVQDDHDPFPIMLCAVQVRFHTSKKNLKRNYYCPISLNQSYAHSYHVLAQVYMMYNGNDESALELINSAIILSPLFYGPLKISKLMFYYILGKDEEAWNGLKNHQII